jgi:hypothetical protein
MVEFFCFFICFAVFLDRLLSLLFQFLQLHFFLHKLIDYLLFLFFLLHFDDIFLSWFGFIAFIMMLVSHMPVVPCFSDGLFVLFLLFFVCYWVWLWRAFCVGKVFARDGKVEFVDWRKMAWTLLRIVALLLEAIFGAYHWRIVNWEWKSRYFGCVYFIFSAIY